MKDAIDDFHDFKEVLDENEFAIANVEFRHDAEEDGARRFHVEMDLIRTE